MPTSEVPHAVRSGAGLSRRRLAACGLAGAFALVATPFAAQAAFPDRPVRIVVPFAPGGGTDTIARVIAELMARDLGQPVVVENRPGAGTIIGTDVVAKSPPDGYTLVMATFAHAVNPSVHATLPYATDSAFAPVIFVGRSPNILVVPAASPYRGVADLVAQAKKDPGGLTYGSFGNATSGHLAGALFAHLADVEITHVPYRGSGPAVTDLIAGRLDMMFATATGVGQAVRGGQLRALAVTSAGRSAAFPDLPTVAEAGVPGYAAESWYGLYAPAGTPREVIARLNAAANAAVRTDMFRRQVAAEGVEIVAGEPAALDAYVRAEEARWRDVIRSAGIRAE